MRDFIKLGIASGLILLQSCTPAAKSNPVTSSVELTTSPSGPDKYEIHWTGNGKELFAGYSIMYKNPSTPMRVENVQGKLPHKVSFSTPQNSIVSASGFAFKDGGKQSDVEIKIYKNGSECGKVVAVGSGASPNKVCQ